MTHKINPNYPLTPEDVNQLIDNIRSLTKLPYESDFVLLATARELQSLFPAHLGWASSKTVSKLLTQRGLPYAELAGPTRRFAIPLGSEALAALSTNTRVTIKHKSQLPCSETKGLDFALQTLLSEDPAHIVLVDYPTMRRAFPHIIGANVTDHALTSALTRISGIRMRSNDKKWRFVLQLNDEANAIYSRQLTLDEEETD